MRSCNLVFYLSWQLYSLRASLTVTSNQYHFYVSLQYSKSYPFQPTDAENFLFIWIEQVMFWGTRNSFRTSKPLAFTDDKNTLRSRSHSDYHYHFVTPEKKGIRIHAFLLPRIPTYNPVNRRIRDPYVRWCEWRTVSLWLTAVYSIGSRAFVRSLSLFLIVFNGFCQ